MKKNVRRIVALLAAACMLCTMGAAFADENAEVVYTTEAPETMKCFQFTIPANWAHTFDEAEQVHYYFQNGPGDVTGGIIAVKEVVSTPENTNAEPTEEEKTEILESALESMIGEVTEKQPVSANGLEGMAALGKMDENPAACIVLLRGTQAMIDIAYVNASIDEDQMAREAEALFNSIMPYNETYGDLAADGENHEYAFYIATTLPEAINHLYFIPAGYSYEDGNDLIAVYGLEEWTPESDQIPIKGVFNADSVIHNLIYFVGDEMHSFDIDFSIVPTATQTLVLEMQDDGPHIQAIG